MTLTIELAPEIEQRLNQVAARQGQDPATFARDAVEEKLQRVDHATDNSGAPGDNGAQAKAGQTPLEQTDKPLMLDQALAGLTGVIHSNDGRGGGRLSEMSGADFGEDLARKQQRGEL